MIPDNVGRQYLTRARIHIAWSHGIGGFGNGIFHAAVTHIVRIERGVVLRIVAHLHSVLETGSFEGRVPVQYALLYRAAPLLGKGRIDVENDGLAGFYQLTGEVFLPVAVARFDAPAVYQAAFVNAVGLRTVHLLAGREIPHAPVVQARTHQSVGRTVKRAVHHHRIRFVVTREREREQGFYFDIQREILHLADARSVALERAFQRPRATEEHRKGVVRLDGTDAFFVASEKARHVNQHAAALLRSNLEALQHRVGKVCAERSRNRVVAAYDVSLLNQVQHNLAAVAAEAHKHGAVNHLAGHIIVCVARLRDAVRENIRVFHHRVGQFEVQLSVLLVQINGKHAVQPSGALDGARPVVGLEFRHERRVDTLAFLLLPGRQRGW